MKKVLIATQNKGKAKDFKQFLGTKGIEVVTLADVNPNLDVVEDQDTFEGNALKKAKEVSELLNMVVLADDSGLAVDYLNGSPGVYSARYAGDHDEVANNKKLLKELKGVEEGKRTARFITCMAVYLPNGEKYTVRGTCEGKILTSPRGTNGFAYDELFEVEGTGKTLAEMTNEERAKYSHRKEAIMKLMESDFFKTHVG